MLYSAEVSMKKCVQSALVPLLCNPANDSSAHPDG
jgi:hypothetical protein